MVALQDGRALTPDGWVAVGRETLGATNEEKEGMRSSRCLVKPLFPPRAGERSPDPNRDSPARLCAWERVRKRKVGRGPAQQSRRDKVTAGRLAPPLAGSSQPLDLRGSRMQAEQSIESCGAHAP
jgi:hypothetical protein